MACSARDFKGISTHDGVLAIRPQMMQYGGRNAKIHFANFAQLTSRQFEFKVAACALQVRLLVGTSCVVCAATRPLASTMASSRARDARSVCNVCSA